ncbi:MAG: PEP-CTERM sorting domain-containing protein [Candidatus Pacebacteria bacterium]|nr:PEP-CTERM sorting domain-containing protein [Candidatus Paceibacterota bacterium]
MKSSLSSIVRLSVILVIIVSLASVRAAVWSGAANTTSGSGTDWNTAGNWNPSGVPGVGVDADCQMSDADYTINYNTPMSADSFGKLLISNDADHTTTLNIDAGGFKSYHTEPSTVTSAGGKIVVGNDGDAGFYGMYSPSTGNADLTVAGDFVVDGGNAVIYAGRYTLVDDGGSITVKGGNLLLNTYQTSPARVTDAVVNLQGGALTFNRGVRLGYYGAGDGVLNITGGTLTLSGATIGMGNDSGLIDMSGGTVTNDSVLILGYDNYSSGNKGVLNLSGGTWTQDGGEQVTLARFRGTEGNALNITGTGLFTTTGDMRIGDETDRGVGSGTLNVNGGSYIATNEDGDATVDLYRGTVRVQNGTLTTDRLTATNGTYSVIDFDGGTMTINDSTDVDNGSTLQVGDGTKEALLVLNGSTHSFANGLSVSNNAALQGTGTITTPAGTTSTSVASGGTLIPGNSIGTLNVTHDLSIAGGAGYDYEISSLSVHDLVAVGGELTLPGTGETVTLNLSLVEPKRTLSAADVELFTYGTLAGYTGVDWTINLIGDYWLGTPSVYDDESGTIYLSGITFIPEPASIALLGLGLLALMRRKRRRG